MKFVSLSSGSSGNCYYLGNENISILIDAGISARAVKKRLSESKIEIESLDLILVTHDHSDHVRHLASIAQKYNKPVVATEKLFNALEKSPFVNKGTRWLKHVIDKEMVFRYKGVEIIAFDIPHDATDNVGFFIDMDGHKFTFVTDIGCVTKRLIDYCKISNHVILESNYDSQMLESGMYPQYLIDRIKGGRGHLSNVQTSGIIKEILHKNLRNIFLCHLSNNNNTPETAYKTSYEALCDSGVIIENIKLFCLPRKAHRCFNL